MSTQSISPQSKRSVAKSAGIIGFATLCSRILGLVRDIIIARLFGVYLYAEAFVIAFRIPNLFRDLLGEGAANAAFVPVFSEYAVKEDKKEFWELANVMLNVLLVVLMLITIFGIIFAPVIVRLIAPGFIASPEKLAVTVKLSRIIFPYILLISLAVYFTAVLNSLKHFAVPAFSPCLLNISIIICALVFGEGITGLASGILVGGVMQLIIQIPVLYKKGFRLQFVRHFTHPAVKTISRLMLPRVLSSSIYQLNNFVDSVFGSLAGIVGDGGVAVLYFAYRLIQFPIGIFSNALAQAILPALSTQALEGSQDKLKNTLSWGLRATFFIMLPASIAFMTLAKPLIEAVFGGGRFDLNSAGLTANALFFYSIGLFSYGGTKILQCGFFALKDTVTPTKIAFLALVLNIVLNAVLIFPLKIGGIALATSISGIISFLVLFNVLRRKIGDFKPRDVVVSFLRILISSICMGIVCSLVIQKSPGMNKFVQLGITAVAGAASYIFFCFILKVREIRELWQWIKKIEPSP